MTAGQRAYSLGIGTIVSQSETTDEPRRSADLQTVGRALRVLSLFIERPATGWALTEVAHVLAMSKATTSRLLATLLSAGYLQRDAVSLRYGLGPVAVALGGAALAVADIRQIALPTMRALTEHTGETSLLHVISGSESVCIEKIASPQPVHVTYDIGHRGPLYAGCSGKSLLAFLPPPEIETMLARLDFRAYTRRTIAGVEQLRPELSETRARGYAESTGELDEGVSSVGVPLLDGAGAVRGAIVVVCPTVRWTSAHRERCISATVDAGRSLCRRLGGERYYDAPIAARERLFT
jgi:DNA-binding IclR family transcriptional regulator